MLDDEMGVMSGDIIIIDIDGRGEIGNGNVCRGFR